MFGNLTARLVLFCTAFAATSRASLALAHHPAPTGAVITPRLEVHEGLDARRGAAILGAGLVGGLLAGLRFRRK